MKKSFAALTTCAALALCSPATAQVSADGSAAQEAKLAQCFVLSTTGADRLALAQWIITALASIPQVKDMASVDAAKKDGADRKMAAIFTRLITVDCLDEAKPLLKAGNNAAFRVAGEAIGRLAIQEVLTDRAANDALESYTKYLDAGAFAKVVK